LARLKSCPDTKPVLLHYDGQRPRGIAVARNVRRRPVLPAHARGCTHPPNPSSRAPHLSLQGFLRTIKCLGRCALCAAPSPSSPQF
jgi:hypothetical protein